MKSARPIFAFLIFVVLLGFFIAVLVIPAARVLVLQHRAESFPAVQGRILSCEVVTVRGSKGGASYRPSFSYEYQVAGQGYMGRRYRYDQRPLFSKYSDAARIVEVHPIGSEIPVYYNPADPHDAVLSPLVEGYDAGVLWVGFPVCLFLLYNLIKVVRETGGADRMAGGVKIISETNTIRVRLPQYDPLAWSWFAVGALSLIAGFFLMSRAHVTLGIAGMTMVFVVLVGLIVYFWLSQKISFGMQDLVIDEDARTVQLPLTYGRRKRMQYAFSQITGVKLQKIAHRGRSRVWYSYAPALVISGETAQRLTDLSQKRAESFTAWLSEKLGVGECNQTTGDPAREDARPASVD